MGFSHKIYVDGKSTRRKQQFVCICDYCGKEFYKEKLYPKNIGIFCSSSCVGLNCGPIIKEIAKSKSILFFEKANLKYNHYFTYDKVNYINVNTPIIITCPKHGDFNTTPKQHLKSKYGCTACSGLKPFTRDEILLKFYERFNNKFDYTYFEYTKTTTATIYI